MENSLTNRVLYEFGKKYFELQQGFAAMFNLCLRARVFTEDQFHAERAQILAFPEMKRWAEFLEELKNSTEDDDLLEALKRFEGPIQ